MPLLFTRGDINTYVMVLPQNTIYYIYELKNWLFSNDPIEITEEAFIFNIGNKINVAQIHILLETKYYIFCTKHLESPLSITHLKNRLKKSYQVMESLAIRNNNLEQFEKEWNPYCNILNN